MKKFLLIALTLGMSLAASAQDADLQPGIYNVNGDETTALTSITAVTKTSGHSLGAVDISSKRQSYKGETSDSPCSTAEFILVINPEKKVATQAFNKYNPFIKSMTPEKMALVPLMKDKNKRIYDEGQSVNGFKMTSSNTIAFEYEQLSDTTWKITAELPAGEYAWAFKIAKFGGFEFSSIFDFTIQQ